MTVSYRRGRDIPVVGDWDGDGDDGIGVVRNDSWPLRDAVAGGAADLNFRPTVPVICSSRPAGD